jgi:hypothetical protein
MDKVRYDTRTRIYTGNLVADSQDNVKKTYPSAKILGRLFRMVS